MYWRNETLKGLYEKQDALGFIAEAEKMEQFDYSLPYPGGPKIEVSVSGLVEVQYPHILSDTTEHDAGWATVYAGVTKESRGSVIRQAGGMLKWNAGRLASSNPNAPRDWALADAREALRENGWQIANDFDEEQIVVEAYEAANSDTIEEQLDAAGIDSRLVMDWTEDGDVILYWNEEQN